MSGRNEQSRVFMLTINNPSADDRSTIFEVGEKVTYAVWQYERGDEGTYHIQAYVELRRKTTLNTVISLFRRLRAHIEIRRGTQEEAVAYCSKEDTRIEGPWSVGEKHHPGKRNDIFALRAKVIEGKTNPELIMDDTVLSCFSRTQRFVAFMKLELSKPRDFETKIIVFWGPTGIGKSRLAKALLPEAWYYSNTKGVWFDSYDGVSDIIFDDFYGNIPYHQWLQLTDRYPVRVETKGGMLQFAPKVIIFTSNKPPWEWWKDQNGEYKDYAPIERRIHQCFSDPLPSDVVIE